MKPRAQSRLAQALATVARQGITSPEAATDLGAAAYLGLLDADAEVVLAVSAVVQSAYHVPLSLRWELLRCLGRGPALKSVALALSGCLEAILLGEELPPMHPDRVTGRGARQEPTRVPPAIRRGK